MNDSNSVFIQLSKRVINGLSPSLIIDDKAASVKMTGLGFFVTFAIIGGACKNRTVSLESTHSELTEGLGLVVFYRETTVTVEGHLYSVEDSQYWPSNVVGGDFEIDFDELYE